VKPISSDEAALIETGPVARHYRPGPPLSSLVDQFWYYYGHTRPHSRERLLPTGTLELVVNLREDRVLTYDPDQLERCLPLPGSLVIGAYSRYFVLDTSAVSNVIGIHFKPGGAFAFLAPPAGELRDQHVGLEALWGVRETALLREQLLEAPSAEAKFAVLERALLRRLRQATPHGAVDLALRRLERAPQLRTLAQVSGSIGLSPRRFIELFTAQVGLTPKLYCRIQRFQRALEAAARPAPVNWTAVALDCGYYDQAHFIRDFRAFSGLSPTAFLGTRRDYPNHVAMPD
jgi:AraC-like DNA-binding protein